MTNIEKIKKLTNELLQYCYEYYILDSPSISDYEYDKLYDTLYTMENEANFWVANSPTRKVQGEVLPFFEKVHHSVPMLSADKSTNIEDVKRFIGSNEVVSSFKCDGATVVCKYVDGKFYQGISRGSGMDGENITHTVKMIKNLPMSIPYQGYLEIRGEAVVPWKYYNEMNKDGSLGHPRNVAAGGLRQLNAQEAASRNIYFYAFTLVNWKDVGVKTKSESLEFLENNGFDVVPNVLSKTQELAIRSIDGLDRERWDIPTDGWCFEYNDLEYGESLGSTGHHDRRLYALKPAAEEHTTVFRGVSYNTCRTGIVSLTALFDPVVISNTTITKATLHNIDYFNSLELGEGDEIVIAKMNEIIPGVIENNTRSNTYRLIDKCQSCGELLVVKNTGTANVLYCPNGNCTSRKLAQFAHFVSKNCMNIQGLSEYTLEKFIFLGYINDFRSIYHLSDNYDKLIKLDGFGAKSIQKLLLAIENSRSVKLENFIAALGIPNIGLSAAKTISNYCNGDFIKFITLWGDSFDWTKLEDFGEITSKSINDYLIKNYADVALLSQEMNFIVVKEKNSDSSFSGIKFCITGSFSQSRDVLKSKLEERGAQFVGSVSKKLDILFAGNNAGSKLAKAQSLGIKIANEEELLKMIGD